MHSQSVADDYDDYFAFNSLFEFDEQVLAEFLQPKGLVADLGCGTGRALVPLVRKGHSGLAIDLSENMLRIVQEKADLDGLPIECVQANLVELDAIAEHSVDHAICMFSTLGMIRGRANRGQAMTALSANSETGRTVGAACAQLLVQPPRSRWSWLADQESPRRAAQQGDRVGRQVVSLIAVCRICTCTFSAGANWPLISPTQILRSWSEFPSTSHGGIVCAGRGCLGL